ncbi:MAG: prepilin-type N-terminal cleavage/methylation domain-containing protein, partial [Fimbriimonadaceae bacterium]|nr:prepilin-type N-terminal cleavage/methylation domain-containing protein [Fimbriimonadaceae bacterium]
MYQKKAFTLIELLVVIAIIAILAAILFPVFAQAKAAAKKTQSLSNVKNVTTAQFLYMSDFDDSVAMNRDCNVFVGGVLQNPCVNGRGYRGWIDLTVPYVKNYSIFKSPEDGQRANRLPAGSLDNNGSPITDGIIWNPRPNGELFGGEYRSSYARNNNFANNGTYTSIHTSAENPANLILIYSFTPNSGAGA